MGAIAADDEQVISIGRACEKLAPDGSCEPSTISSASLDPTTGSWTKLALPEGVKGQSLTSVSLLQVTDHGSFVAVVRLRVEDQDHSMMLTFDGGRWSSQAEVDDSSLKSACATRESLFLPSALPEDASDQGDGPTGTTVGFTMTRLDLGSGSSVEVHLPPLAPTFGGAGVVMGCGPNVPTIAAGAPGGTTLVASYIDGEWQDLAGVLDEAGVLPGEVTTGPRGVLVGGFSLSSDDTKKLSYAAVTADGDVIRLDPTLLVDTMPVWRGRSGSVIYIEQGHSGRGSAPIDMVDVFP